MLEKLDSLRIKEGKEATELRKGMLVYERSVNSNGYPNFAGSKNRESPWLYVT